MQLISICLIITLTLQGLADTTLARDGQQRVPLMSGIGDAQFVNDLSEAEVVSAARYVAGLHKQRTKRGLSGSILPLPEGVQRFIRPRKPATAVASMA